MSRETKLIAKPPNVGVEPVPAAPDGTRPTLHAGRVWFTAVKSVNRRGVVEPAIYSIPARGGELRLEVGRAFNAYASGPGLYFVRADPNTFANWKLHRRAWGGKRSVVIDSGSKTSRFSGIAVASNGNVMWQRLDGPNLRVKKLQVLGRSARSPRLIFEETNSSSFAYFPVMTRRYALFSRSSNSGYRAFAFDLRRGKLKRLDIGNVYQTPQGEARVLSWRGASKDADVVVGRLP